MRSERIRALPSRKRGPSRYDCVFVETDPTAPRMRGLDIARVRLFFSFIFRGVFYPCALVRWYSRIGDGPDDDTGMWVVKEDEDPDGNPNMAVIHLDSIIRAAHLIGVYGEGFLPRHFTPEESLDIFDDYYVNKYIDHHSFEIAF